MLFGPDKGWLDLTVVAAAVTALGALLGIFLKDFIFSRSFEIWKQHQALEALYNKYRDPLVLSARELISRVVEIIDEYPPTYLTAQVLALRPERQIHNSADDEYYQRYRLVSTTYRFCAFLGWLELYRQEGAYLPSGNAKHSKQLENAVRLIRSDLSDGHINIAKDWEEWRDTMVFREELRAIGDAMIEVRGEVRTIAGYGRFSELFDANDSSPIKKWSRVALNFLIDLEPKQKDFRKIRLTRLGIHLIDLMELLDPSPVEPRFVEFRTKHGKTLSKNSQSS